MTRPELERPAWAPRFVARLGSCPRASVGPRARGQVEPSGVDSPFAWRLHYWPSRASLTVDAVKALFDAMAARLRSEMATRAARGTNADPARRVHVAIALLWSSFDSSLFRAELELWVAARHDAELRPLVVAHDRRLGAEIVELCHDMFGPELSSHPRFTEAIGLLTHGMRGAALVVDLHPNHRQHLVAEWHRQICLTLDVPIDPATS